MNMLQNEIFQTVSLPTAIILGLYPIKIIKKFKTVASYCVSAVQPKGEGVSKSCSNDTLFFLTLLYSLLIPAFKALLDRYTSIETGLKFWNRYRFKRYQLQHQHKT